MDGQHRPPLNVDDLDRALIDALRIDPSVDFRARVRERVTGESMRPRWVAAAPLVLAASVVIIAGAFVFTREAVEDRTAQTIALGADVALPALPQPVAVTAAQPVRPTARRAVRARRLAAGNSEPEVLLSASEQSGVRLLFESAASGRLQLPPEMLQDLSLPIVRLERASEGDNQ